MTVLSYARREALIRQALAGIAGCSLLFLALIMVFLFMEGLPVFSFESVGASSSACIGTRHPSRRNSAYFLFSWGPSPLPSSHPSWPYRWAL